MRLEAIVTGNRRAAVDHLVSRGAKPVKGSGEPVRIGEMPDGSRFILVDENDLHSLDGYELSGFQELYTRRLRDRDREHLKARIR
jgi:hypothetical protein